MSCETQTWATSMNNLTCSQRRAVQLRCPNEVCCNKLDKTIQTGYRIIYGSISSSQSVLALDRKYRHHTETCVNYSACFVACKYYEYFYVLIGFRLVYQFRNLVYASRIHLQKSRPTALKSACPSFRSHCFLLRSNLLLRIWADQNAKGWIDKLHPWGQDPLRDQCTMGGSITQYKQ